ncbi:hypothetical protein D3C85_1638230 [compost metagenome]
MFGVTHQANRLPGDTQADGDFGAHRHEIEIVDEGAAAQLRLLVPAIKANFSTHQAGADGDSGFGDGCAGHRRPLIVKSCTDLYFCTIFSS